MTDEVKHYQVNGKYKVQFERSAVKDRDGFKCEANGDDLETVMKEASELYQRAQGWTAPTAKAVAGPAAEEKNIKGETKCP